MNIVSSIFALLLVAGVIFLKTKLPAIKGKIGEKSVSTVLSLLPNSDYVVINDVMFRNGNFTTQIDHIVVSKYGIFVIETKNYKGWIFGNSYKDYWTQNIWGNKYPLYNPLLQNKKHISFLLNKFQELRDKRTCIFPIVVFLRASKLKLTGNCDCVLRLRHIKSYIRSFTKEVFTNEECHYFVSLFQSDNIESKRERIVHQKNVKSAISWHHNMVSQGICPNCGGALVLRNGRYGDFYGCSNYPHCKYTR